MQPEKFCKKSLTKSFLRGKVTEVKFNPAKNKKIAARENDMYKVADSTGGMGSFRYADVISVIHQAAQEHCHVRMFYIDAKGKKSFRDVKPSELKRTDQGRINLVGYDLKRQAPRTFALSGIQHIEVGSPVEQTWEDHVSEMVAQQLTAMGIDLNQYELTISQMAFSPQTQFLYQHKTEGCKFWTRAFNDHQLTPTHKFAMGFSQ
jgi:predicted DNA-binding transcriptional regulator YafY